jgi:hypothetical protein
MFYLLILNLEVLPLSYNSIQTVGIPIKSGDRQIPYILASRYQAVVNPVLTYDTLLFGSPRTTPTTDSRLVLYLFLPFPSKIGA